MYRVMIVDDEPLILAGIASLLDWKEYGCEIAGKAANGQQALKLMEEQMPDIVITDIKMPGMDGIGFMKAVKERGWDDVSFILLTNLEEFSLARQALSLGAVEYLVKMELTEEKLADSLRLAMERQELKRKADAAGTAGTVSREEALKDILSGCWPATAEAGKMEPAAGTGSSIPFCGNRCWPSSALITDTRDFPLILQKRIKRRSFPLRKISSDRW